MLGGFASCNFRMNEFTGAVLKGQVQKLETICKAVRRNARKVREGIADLPGLKLRKTPDLEGDLGVTVFLDHGTRERRDRFLRAMRAEGIAASGPGGSVILPTDERIENKVTVHPDWPSFQRPEGKAIRYGAECCPRTIDILGPPRRRDHGSQLHRRRRERHHCGHPQGLPGHALIAARNQSELPLEHCWYASRWQLDSCQKTKTHRL